MNRSLRVFPLHEHVAGLQFATDEDPYLGTWTIGALADAVARIRADESIRAVVLLGGQKHFSAGAKRSDLAAPEAGRKITSYVGELPRLLLSIPVPTVAAMRGHAIGGGFIFGLWADMVVLAEESLYGANFMALGLTPGMGSTTIVEESVGGPLGREMLFTGRMVKGRELASASCPLSQSVVTRDRVEGHALDLAIAAAEPPRKAVVLLKERLAAERRARLDAAFSAEREMHAAMYAAPETGQRIAQRYAWSEGVVEE